jgi:hypothetical protein
METLLVRLMFLTALLQLGFAVSDFENCNSRNCVQKIEKASRDVLKIGWKPISLFPEEAKRFLPK